MECVVTLHRQKKGTQMKWPAWTGYEQNWGTFDLYFIHWENVAHSLWQSFPLNGATVVFLQHLNIRHKSCVQPESWKRLSRPKYNCWKLLSFFLHRLSRWQGCSEYLILSIRTNISNIRGGSEYIRIFGIRETVQPNPNEPPRLRGWLSWILDSKGSDSLCCSGSIT